jgi:hypothetical protein
VTGVSDLRDRLQSSLGAAYTFESELVGGEAIAAHDVWMVQFPRAPIYALPHGAARGRCEARQVVVVENWVEEIRRKTRQP